MNPFEHFWAPHGCIHKYSIAKKMKNTTIGVGLNKTCLACLRAFGRADQILTRCLTASLTETHPDNINNDGEVLARVCFCESEACDRSQATAYSRDTGYQRRSFITAAEGSEQPLRRGASAIALLPESVRYSPRRTQLSFFCFRARVFCPFLLLFACCKYSPAFLVATGSYRRFSGICGPRHKNALISSYHSVAI